MCVLMKSKIFIRRSSLGDDKNRMRNYLIKTVFPFNLSLTCGSSIPSNILLFGRYMCFSNMVTGKNIQMPLNASQIFHLLIALAAVIF